MPVPDFQSLMRPILEAATEVGGETSIRALAPKLASALALQQSDLEEMLPSGRQTRFLNRLHWAKTFMERAHLVSATRRGYFKTTDRTATLLKQVQGSISMRTLERFLEYVAWRAASVSGASAEKDGTASLDAAVIAATPEDLIEEGAATLTKALKAELLERLVAESPKFFETFIRDLLLAMGYGGGSAERGIVIGGPGDGGIDGVIHEDALGLDAVYIQAKRYSPGSNISRPDLQRFVGSMTGEGASKGVFVTTSGFTSEARDYVRRITQRIVLIDGDRLAELAIRHDVGVRTRRTFALKSVDEDYFGAET